MELSAYVPCRNNAGQVGAAIASLRTQSRPVAEIVVVDDGSTDGSAEAAAAAGARVVRHASPLGRGAANARGILETSHDLVITVGATNVLPPDFADRAAAWFADERVAAVCARATPPPPTTAADRWRARHLFGTDRPGSFTRQYHLVTTAAMLRRAAVLEAGNFDPALVHTEDGELGQRLTAREYEILFDPELRVIPGGSDSLVRTLERHWRWHAGVRETISLRGYAKATAYAVTVMARDDVRAGDWAGAAISAWCPHHHFWLTVARRLTNRTQRAT
jgi:glycosyltransferase involved in cell wall biosynthesis